MKNQYDDPSFFEQYSKMSRSKGGLKAAGEWPLLEKLFTDLEGATVLDLGCGYGWHSRYAIECGAKEVLALDGSHKMLEKAISLTDTKQIEYRYEKMEEMILEKEKYDVVISNLALHYVADLNKVFEKVFDSLKTGGYFLFNIEHPVFTAGINQMFVEQSDGSKYWPVDDYYIEGERKTYFLGKEVIKHHHTMTTILNGLLQCGFTIEVFEEVQPTMEIVKEKGWWDELKRPMMLLVKVRK